MRYFYLLVVLALAVPAANAHAPALRKSRGRFLRVHAMSIRKAGASATTGAISMKKALSFANFNDEAEAKKAGVEVGPEADKKPASLVKGASVLPPAPKPTPPPPAPKPAFIDPKTVPDFGQWVSPEGIAFVKIPAGSYVRGTTDAQKATLQDRKQWSPLNAVEQPAKMVTITRPFLLSKTEVTQAQWNALMVPPEGEVKFTKNGKPIKKKDAVENPSAFKKGGEAPNRARGKT